MSYYITNDTKIDQAKIKVLANNGKRADQKVELAKAPIIGGGTAYFLTTNGDPVPVAAISVDGDFLWGRDAFGGIASDDLPWLADEIWLNEATDKKFVAALTARLAD